TNIGLTNSGLHMTAYDRRPEYNAYAFILSSDSPSIFKNESDEETVKTDAPVKEEDKKEKETAKKKDSKKESTDKSKTEDKATDKVKPVKVDYANINNRIIALPIPAAAYNFNGNVENTLLSVRNGSLIAFDLNKLEEKTLVDKLGSYAVSADGKQMLYSTRQGYYIVNAGQKPAGESGKLKMDNIKLQVDPAAEWNQIFNEVWAMQKEFFYVENMHGVDWNAVKAKYEKFLPYVNHRSDLGYLLNEMMGEMVVGHNYIMPGDEPSAPSVSTGVLGADYAIENNR